MKKCTKCGLLKDELEFYNDITKNDGLTCSCKLCHKKYYDTPNFKKHRKEYLASPKIKKHKKEYRKNYRLTHREKVLVHSYTRIDKIKNRTCNLTIDWLKENITSKPCIYCGETEKIGCDRIDNSKGHTMNNVVPCCEDCNYTRGDMYSFKEMLYIIGPAIKLVKKERQNKI